MMSGTNPNARREVNDALIGSGGAAVGQMVDTSNSSIEKRRRNKEEREKREAEEKKAAKEKADAAVRRDPTTLQEVKALDLLCANGYQKQKGGTSG
jgi:hypothetical protein